jgi:hypothetical protein
VTDEDIAVRLTELRGSSRIKRSGKTDTIGKQVNVPFSSQVLPNERNSIKQY